MGRKRKVIGQCHLCGSERPLTFEHTPGEECYNNRRLRLTRGEDAFADGDDLDQLRYIIVQRGLGAETLCEDCNSRTGGWYGREFTKWTRQGARALGCTRGQRDSLVVFPFRLHPLRVIKQALLLFVSTCGPHFLTKREELRATLLNREAQGLPGDIRVYLYLAADRVRVTGIMASTALGIGRVRVMAEFAFPPFGYLITFDSEKPDPRLLDISFFSHHGFWDEREWSLPVALLPVYTPFVADYRDRESVLREAALN